MRSANKSAGAVLIVAKPSEIFIAQARMLSAMADGGLNRDWLEARSIAVDEYAVSAATLQTVTCAIAGEGEDIAEFGLLMFALGWQVHADRMAGDLCDWDAAGEFA